MNFLPAIFKNMQEDYYLIPTILLAVSGAISTTRSVFCRLFHGSTENLYRWSAAWPVIMWLIALWTTGQIGQYHQSARHFSPVVALAFGFGFSAAMFWIRSWYFWIWGALFLCLFARVAHFWYYDLSVYISA